MGRFNYIQNEGQQDSIREWLTYVIGTNMESNLDHINKNILMANKFKILKF